MEALKTYKFMFESYTNGSFKFSYTTSSGTYSFVIPSHEMVPSISVLPNVFFKAAQFKPTEIIFTDNFSEITKYQMTWN